MRRLFSVPLSILIYNFIFPVRLNLIPGSEFILYSLVFFWGLLYLGKTKKIYTLDFFYPLIYFSLSLVILGLSSILLNSSEDIIPLIAIVKFIFAVLMSYILSIISCEHFGKDATYYIFKVCVVSCLTISVSCMLEFLIPSFKVLFYNLIDTSGNIEYDQSFRVHGLATGGGASLSLGLAIGSVLSLFLSNKTTGIEAIIWGVGAFFIFITTIIVGRTGFFLLLAFYLLYFTLYLSITKIIALLVFFLLISLIIGNLDNDTLEILYNYGLEPVKNYIENGRFESKTTNQVLEMFYFPETKHLIFGAGFWRYPTNNYVLSDVGYMKILMSYGIFGFIIFYAFQVYIYLKSFKFYSFYFRSRLIFIFVFFVMFVAEFKEEFFVQNYAFKITILLATLSFYIKYNLKCIEFKKSN